MRIEKKFKEISIKDRSALITYVTAGDPSLDVTPDIVFKLEESGADIVELGVPFSDPMADGPAIQLASERALESGTTLHGVLDTVRKVRMHSEIPILLFGYYNPFYAYGLRKLAEDAREVGADGILVVDLPPEEAEEVKVHTDNEGLDLVFLLAPTSTTERIKLVSDHASGFVYLVSVTGVTGERPNFDYSLDSIIKEIRTYIKLPVGIGFGVSSPLQAKKIAGMADAVIVGSSIVRLIERHRNNKRKLFGELSEFVRGLSQACIKQELKHKDMKIM